MEVGEAKTFKKKLEFQLESEGLGFHCFSLSFFLFFFFASDVQFYKVIPQ